MDCHRLQLPEELYQTVYFLYNWRCKSILATRSEFCFARKEEKPVHSLLDPLPSYTQIRTVAMRGQDPMWCQVLCTPIACEPHFLR